MPVWWHRRRIALKAGVEILGEGETAKAFRDALLGKIGAWVVDHPDQEISYEELFPDFIKRLRDDFYGKRRALIVEVAQSILKVGSDDFRFLDQGLQERVMDTLAKMRNKYGYCESCALESLGFLVGERYS